VTPFVMRGVRPRGAPPFPFVSAFPELNVRTYVTTGGKPGIWFISLDAGSRLAVQMARLGFSLPYFKARMRASEGQQIDYTSVRRDWRGGAAEFRGRYQPVGEVYQSQPGHLDHWLTERYCLYSVDDAGALYRGEIHHPMWPLQRGEVEIDSNTMAAAQGIELPEIAPLVHFSKRLDVVGWWPMRVGQDEAKPLIRPVHRA
jgi:uncharacterized protein YqjF (DUF2071 family)